MTEMLENLLAPATLGELKLRNRIVMAPMTRSRAGDGDVATDLVAQYYRQRASAGLIISEASQISAQGKGYPRTPGIFTAEQVAGWSKVTRAVHEEGGTIVIQLWHVGRLSHSSIQPGGGLPVAPSPIACEGQIYTTSGLVDFETPRALETDEIPGIVEDFRLAGARAMEAGFDGIEVHAANGYLIDQFLRDGTNHRTDRYGGSLENRFRFLDEIVEALIEEVGAGRIGVRLSPVFSTYSMADSAPQVTFGQVAEWLGAKGLAYLHAIELGQPGFDFAAFRARYAGPFIGNGQYDAARAETAIASGHATAVAFGSPYIANPDLVERFRRGLALAAPEPTTFYQGEEVGYTDYLPAQ